MTTSHGTGRITSFSHVAPSPDITSIDDGGSWTSFPLRLFTTLLMERVADALQCAVIGPQIEIVVDRAFRRQVFRDCAPLAAGGQNGCVLGLKARSFMQHIAASADPRQREATMSKSYVSIGSQWLRRILRLQVSAGLLLALNLSANAIETAMELCERAVNVDAAIEACSSIIQTDKDRQRLALAYFNRAGWHLKKDDVNRAASDLSEAIRFEPDFAAALTKRGLLEERLNDLRSARADFAAVLKLPQPIV
jgi:hypothetical protein